MSDLFFTSPAIHNEYPPLSTTISRPPHPSASYRLLLRHAADIVDYHPAIMSDIISSETNMPLRVRRSIRLPLHSYSSSCPAAMARAAFSNK